MSNNYRIGPKILIVSRVFPPAFNPEAFCTYKFAVSLKKFGVDVKILTCWGNEPKKDFNYFYLSESDLFLIPAWQGNYIKRVIYYFSYALINRVPIRYGWFVGKGVKIYKQSIERIDWKPDIIYGRGLPSSSYYLAYRLSKLLNIPLILHLSDPWPPKYLPLPYSQDGFIENTIEQFFFKKILKKVNGITFPSRALANYMSSKIPMIKTLRTEIIPHIIVEGINIQSCIKNKISQKSLLNDRLMEIIHTGTLDDHRTPLYFLQGLKKFVETFGPLIKVKFIGHKYPKIKSIITTLGLDRHVELLEPVTYDKAIMFSQMADVLLLIEAPSEVGVFLPSKFVDYCSVGKPILALSPTIGEVSFYLEKIGCHVVPPNDPTRIFEAITCYYKLWKESAINKIGTKSLCQYFEENIIIGKFLSFIKEIIK